MKNLILLILISSIVLTMIVLVIWIEKEETIVYQHYIIPAVHTDSSGTWNVNAINAAIEYDRQSVEIDGLYIPAGTFKVNSPLIFSNTICKGQFQWEEMSKITLSNVKVHGNK